MVILVDAQAVAEAVCDRADLDFIACGGDGPTNGERFDRKDQGPAL